MTRPTSSPGTLPPRILPGRWCAAVNRRLRFAAFVAGWVFALAILNTRCSAQGLLFADSPMVPPGGSTIYGWEFLIGYGLPPDGILPNQPKLATEGYWQFSNGFLRIEAWDGKTKFKGVFDSWPLTVTQLGPGWWVISGTLTGTLLQPAKVPHRIVNVHATYSQVETSITTPSGAHLYSLGGGTVFVNLPGGLQ